MDIVSPPDTVWGLVKASFFVTTKFEIGVNLLESLNPTYDDYGFFTMTYQPPMQYRSTLKVRPYVSGIDMGVFQQGTLKLIYDRYSALNDGRIRIKFSSPSSSVFYIQLHVITFDPDMPGVVFSEGIILQQNLNGMMS